jgi:hypothetical protein
MNVFEELVAGENPLGAWPGLDHGRIVPDAKPHHAAWRGRHSPPDAINQLIFANTHLGHAIGAHYRSRVPPKRVDQQTLRQFHATENGTRGQLALNAPLAQVTFHPVEFEN